MFDKIKNFANARRSTANDLKDDQQNVPLLTTMVNEKAKQTAMESSIKDIYKVIIFPLIFYFKLKLFYIE